MTKSRNGMRLQEALHVKRSNYRSKDMEALLDRYNIFSKKLHGLVVSLKAQHVTMMKHIEARQKVSDHFFTMSAGTPLYAIVGSKDAGVDDPSFRGIQMKQIGKYAESANKFSTHILEEVVMLEKTIASRVAADRQKSENLRRDYEHYDKKMKALQSTIANKDSKGKPIEGSLLKKEFRNEEKLKAAKEAHESFSQEFCVYLEEVTERAWKDLIPLMLRMVVWDQTLVDNQAEVLTEMQTVVDQITAMGSTAGLEDCTQFRTKALKSDDVQVPDGQPNSVSGNSDQEDIETIGTESTPLRSNRKFQISRKAKSSRNEPHTDDSSTDSETTLKSGLVRRS